MGGRRRGPGRGGSGRGLLPSERGGGARASRSSGPRRGQRAGRGHRVGQPGSEEGEALGEGRVGIVAGSRLPGARRGLRGDGELVTVRREGERRWVAFGPRGASTALWLLLRRSAHWRSPGASLVRPRPGGEARLRDARHSVAARTSRWALGGGCGRFGGAALGRHGRRSVCGRAVARAAGAGGAAGRHRHGYWGLRCAGGPIGAAVEVSGCVTVVAGEGRRGRLRLRCCGVRAGTGRGRSARGGSRGGGRRCFGTLWARAAWGGEVGRYRFGGRAERSRTCVGCSRGGPRRRGALVRDRAGWCGPRVPQLG